MSASHECSNSPYVDRLHRWYTNQEGYPVCTYCGKTKPPAFKHPFRSARRAKPTQRHLPGIWEGLLGTVYARSPQGEVRYFDYDWEGARAFCGADREGADLRLDRAKQSMSLSRDAGSTILRGQAVLWVRLP